MMRAFCLVQMNESTVRGGGPRTIICVRKRAVLIYDATGHRALAALNIFKAHQWYCVHTLCGLDRGVPEREGKSVCAAEHLQQSFKQPRYEDLSCFALADTWESFITRSLAIQ